MTTQNKYGLFLRTMQKELGDYEGEIIAANIKKDESVFIKSGQIWACVLAHFAGWIRENARFQIKVLQRDCWPLKAITGWSDMYLTRKICGIDDELAKSRTAEQRLLKQYIKQETGGRPFSMVDSGFYGSIVQNLALKGFAFQPLFLFSKNPLIPGFFSGGKTQALLSGILPKDEAPQFCSALIDSFECCIPKRYQSPAKLTRNEDGEVAAALVPNDPLSIRFCELFKMGMKTTRNWSLGEVLEIFSKEYALAKQNKSGIMTKGSPAWSKADEFIGEFEKNTLKTKVLLRQRSK
ncbi:MAG: hypothetical protein LBL46_03945 [Rickettsiales bacterium]|nr:hypothetical protein [Rickettsiales bacterium]